MGFMVLYNHVCGLEVKLVLFKPFVVAYYRQEPTFRELLGSELREVALGLSPY